MSNYLTIIGGILILIYFALYFSKIKFFLRKFLVITGTLSIFLSLVLDDVIFTISPRSLLVFFLLLYISLRIIKYFLPISLRILRLIIIITILILVIASFVSTGLVL